MRRESGVITIYLALTLGLILAMIVTTIEVARVNTTKTYINRVFQTSMESALCDYYLPLYDRYHIFGLHLEGEDEKERQELLVDKVERRAKDSLEPETSKTMIPYLTNETSHTFLMCNPKLKDIGFSDMIYLTDQEGRFMRNQAIAYEKYAAPLDLLELILEATGVMEKAKTASGVISEKMSLEQDLAAIDQKILRLMELIDGIETDEYGIKQSSFFKNLSVSDYFVKRLVIEVPSESSVKLNHTKIFQALESSYLRISDEFSKVRQNGYSIYNAVQEHAVSDSSGNEEFIFEDVQQKEEVDKISSEFNVLNKLSREVFASINSKISESLEIINQIEEEREKIAEDYSKYKENLEEKKVELGEELYAELISDDSDILAYTDSCNNKFGLVYDIKQMSDTLHHNQEVLNGVINSEFVPFSIDSKGFDAWNMNLTYLESQLSAYSLQGLSFDYSDIELEEFDLGFFSILGGIALSSILKGVIDSDTDISKEKLSGVNLPSYYQQELDSDQEKESFEDFDKMYLEIGGLEFANMDISMDGISDIAFDIGESLLFLAYINDHTTNFISEEYKVGQVLKYEQEYLLFGNLKDKENLEEFVARLVMIRTMLNMITILSDTQKVNEAQSTAEIMSVTGLPFLVSITKYLILFYWAYSEARVETAALLKGKSVSLFTTSKDFVVAYSDLLGMTTSKVVTLADKYEAKSMLKLDYTAYLLINLFFVGEQEKTYRVMDLIQENLRYEYEDSFRIKHCLFSFSSVVNSYLPQKFLFLPFFQKENITIDGYQIKSKLSVTY